MVCFTTCICSLISTILFSRVTWIVVALAELAFVYMFVKVWSSTSKFRNPLPSGDFEKFAPFQRTDAKHWNFLRFFLFGLLFFWIRLILITFFIAISALNCYFWGKLFNFDRWPTIRYLCNRYTSFNAHILLLISGIIISHENVDFDYSEYLGKDYTKSTTGVLNVSNHVTYWDAMIYLAIKPCGFMAKHTVSTIPLVGDLARAAGSLFINREAKNDKKIAIQQILDKMNAIMEGKDRSNFFIFPEATTTAGSHLIDFKKGSFVGNFPVKPWVHLVDQNDWKITYDVMPLPPHFFLQLCKPLTFSRILELPVFIPNENLYEGKQGERWEIYAAAVKDVMAKVGNLKKSNINFLDIKGFLKDAYDMEYTDL